MLIFVIKYIVQSKGYWHQSQGFENRKKNDTSERISLIEIKAIWQH